jgi:hypothetical protein
VLAGARHYDAVALVGDAISSPDLEHVLRFDYFSPLSSGVACWRFDSAGAFVTDVQLSEPIGVSASVFGSGAVPVRRTDISVVCRALLRASLNERWKRQRSPVRKSLDLTTNIQLLPIFLFPSRYSTTNCAFVHIRL